MRKVLVVSSVPPRDGKPKTQWLDLCNYTWATLKKYCERHGYDFRPNVSNIVEPIRARGTSPVYRLGTGLQHPISHFIKFRLFEHYLSFQPTYDWVVWVDADCLVTNYEVPLDKYFNQLNANEKGTEAQVGDIIVPFDVNGLHPTIIMARNTVLTRGLFWACANAGQTLFAGHDWDDNLALRFFLDHAPYRNLFWNGHSAGDLCAMHPGLYPIPADIREPYEWTPNSLTLHLSALSLDSRIALAKEYCERLNLLGD